MRGARSLAAAVAVGVGVLASARAGARRRRADRRHAAGCRIATCARASCGRRRRSAPTRASLGARVAWNQFGTPSSLVDPGGALATGVARRHARGRRARVARRQRGAVPARLGRRASSSSSDTALAGDVGHAVTLRQRVGGLDGRAAAACSRSACARDGAAGGSISAAGTVTATRALAGKADARARAGGPEGRRERRRARARSRRSSRSPSRPRRASRRSGSAGVADVQRAQGGRVPDASATASCRPTRRSCSTREGAEPEALPHVRRRPQRRDPRAREPRRQRRRAERRAGRAGRRSPASCPPPTAAARRATARTPSPTAPASARSTCSPNADIAGAGHRAAALPRHDARRAGRHAHARPSGSATRPRPACPPATTSSRCASSATAPRRSSRARTPARSRSTTARRRRRTRRAGACSPARRCTTRSAADPWNNPNTDIREDWCWKASANAGRLRRDRRQPRVARAVGPRRQAERADEHDARQQRAHRRVVDEPAAGPAPTQFRPVEPDARLHVPVHERLEQRRLQPGDAVRRGVRARPELRHLGRGHEPVRAAQPDARLVLPARLHRGELERAGLQLRR